MGDTGCILRGTLLGVPNIIGGCASGAGTSAACTTPLTTVYAMVTTTTRRLCAIGTALSDSSSDVVIPSVNFSFRPTTNGYYSIYYNTERVTLDLASGSLILPPTTGGTGVVIDVKYGNVGTQNARAMLVRVAGNYQYAVTNQVIPVFQTSTTPTTDTFILASRLAMINGEECLVPVLLTRDAYTSPLSSLPESFALTNWSVSNVTSGGAIISYPLAEICSDNTKETLQIVQSTFGWAGWVYFIVTIVLIILLFVMANALRRTEYVQDPRLPQAVALVQSIGR